MPGLATVQPQRQRAPRSAVSSVPRAWLQRKCVCRAAHSAAEECAECRNKRQFQRKAATAASAGTVPPIVNEVLQSPGQPLDAATRAFMEPRFGHDFSHVRIHTDRLAAESASAVSTLAYTVGRDIVFAATQHAPHSDVGRGLLAHELTHVVQQGAGSATGPLDVLDDRSNGRAESEAESIGKRFQNQGLPHLPGRLTAVTQGTIQGQFVTPLAPGGGYRGLMERDRARVRGLMSTPFHVCARPLQIPGAELLGINHAYIEAPPHQYAVIGPLCDPTDGGPNNVIRGAVAHKWNDSPDPCGKRSRCVPCHPKPGVTDVADCMRDAFTAYNDPSLYKALGPNSNTFAGTLARACCRDMVPQPATLGTVPGWDDSPAPSRTGVCAARPSC